jgi:hypothetical protein
LTSDALYVAKQKIQFLQLLAAEGNYEKENQNRDYYLNLETDLIGIFAVLEVFRQALIFYKIIP